MATNVYYEQQVAEFEAHRESLYGPGGMSDRCRAYAETPDTQMRYQSAMETAEGRAVAEGMHEYLEDAVSDIRQGATQFLGTVRDVGLETGDAETVQLAKNTAQKQGLPLPENTLDRLHRVRETYEAGNTENAQSQVNGPNDENSEILTPLAASVPRYLSRRKGLDNYYSQLKEIDKDTTIIGQAQYGARQKAGETTTDVDCAVLSQVAYFSGKRKENAFRTDEDTGETKNYEEEYYAAASCSAGMTVGKYAEKLLGIKEKYHMTGDDYEETKMMRALVDSERYAHMYIAHNDTRNTGKVETTVLTIETGNGETVFAVQGTVQKGEDWKNDAEFGLDDFTIEEDYVAKRIQQHMKEHPEYSDVLIAGHSQGGREAESAMLLLDDESYNRVKRAVSLDGPGYTDAMIQKYKSRFERSGFANKMTHIGPTTSMVGEIGSAGIDSNSYQYVESSKEMMDQHIMYSWQIDPETGNFIQKDQDPVSKIVDRLVDVAMNDSSSARSQQLLRLIFTLTADPNDAERMDFKNIAANMDSMDSGDIWVLCESLVSVLGVECLAILSETEIYVDLIDLVLQQLNVDMPDWAKNAIAKSLTTFITIKLIKVVLVLKAVVFVMDAMATLREAAFKKACAAYIACHTEMHVSYNALDIASAHLRAANASVKELDNCLSNMCNCWEEQITVEEVVSDIVVPQLKWVRKVINIGKVLSLLGLSSYGVKAVDPDIQRGAEACESVAENAKNICSGKTGFFDTIFRVNPGLLDRSSDDLLELAKELGKIVENAENMVKGTGSFWEAEDQAVLSAKTEQLVSDRTGAIEALKSQCETLASIAAAYSEFQKSAVEIFMNI